MWKCVSEASPLEAGFPTSMLNWTHGKLILPIWTSGKVMVPNCQFHPKLAEVRMRVIALLTAKLWFQLRQAYG
ncbi:hypothetical protein [Calothrix parietina]|uniref:hypothetical protein n=1 Tax=Calothrix parietina TaxID=32054 RepID=UPI0030DA03C6